jgi:hypothetical protein
MHLRIVLPLAVALALPAGEPAQAGPPTGASTASSRRRATMARARAKAKPRPRCRRGDLFCVTQVVSMEGADSQGLSEAQVESTMSAHRARAESCLIEARRRDPKLRAVRVELAVAGKGQVLATRVDGKRASPLARCLHRQLRGVRFPRFTAARTVAAVTLSVPQ